MILAKMRVKLLGGIMFKMFLGFLPWIILTLFDYSSLALFFALFFCFKELQQKFLFAWGTLVFLILYVFVEQFLPISNYKISIESSALILISLSSLLIKRPFTIDYARLFTPQMAWHSPIFININHILTYCWIFLFLIMTLSNSSLVSLVIFGLGFVFCLFFPNLYKQYQSYLANKNNPFLHGNYAPIREENDFEDLVVEGFLPEAFPRGVYMRNGSNPQFEPISYVYPFDGDGMIHALYFNGESISYRNRYVKTLGYEVEKRAGKAIYGGIKMPLPIDEKYLLKGQSNSPFKNGAFIHVVPFANRILAMLEANPAYELDKELNTLGLFQAGQKQAPNINAHVKICPDSKELFAISYDLNPPYLVLHQISPDGKLLKTVSIDKSKPTMIHDFAITSNYVIIFDCPLVFDVEAAMKGDSVLQWHEEMGVCIRIFKRHELDKPPKIIHTKAFFVFHFANAFENDNQLMIDYIYYDYLKIVNDAMQIPGMTPHRMTIDLTNGSIEDKTLSDLTFEFPRINLNYLGKPYRYIYGVAQKNLHLDPIGFDSIIKYDLDAHVYSVCDFGPDFEIGEAIFIPEQHCLDEDAGFLIVYAYQLSSNKSYAYILDARDIKNKICRILLPRRVPFGLHGSWVNMS